MKKLLIAALAALCFAGCSHPIESEPVMYIMSAFNHNNEPVYVLIYDAGTPNYIYDDEIVGVVPNHEIANAHE